MNTVVLNKSFIQRFSILCVVAVFSLYVVLGTGVYVTHAEDFSGSGTNGGNSGIDNGGGSSGGSGGGSIDNDKLGDYGQSGNGVGFGGGGGGIGGATIDISPGNGNSGNDNGNAQTSSNCSSSALTAGERSAILNILQSFGVDQTTMNSVSAALNCGSVQNTQTTTQGTQTTTNTSSTPTGTLTISGCTITSGTTCVITPSWTTTGVPSLINGNPDIGVAVFQNGTYFGGSAVSGTSYIFSTNPNSSTSFNLPAGTYNIQLSYYTGTGSIQWTQLATQQVTVTAPTTSGAPTGTLTASGCTVTTGTTCAVTPSWTVTGTNPNGSLNLDITVYQNGTYFGGSANYGKSYISSTNPTGSASFNLPNGTYNIQLANYNGTSWSQLAVQTVSVTGNTITGTTPTGSITATGCTLPVGTTKCLISVNWTSQGTSQNGAPETQVDVYDNFAANHLYLTGSQQISRVNIWNTAANNDSYQFGLPLNPPTNTYTFVLWGENNGTWSVLNQTTATVTNAPAATAAVDTSSLTSTSGTPLITGTATNASTLTVSVGATTYLPTPASDGTWALDAYDNTFGTAFPPGSYPITVKDAGGNILTTATIVIGGGAESATINSSSLTSTSGTPLITGTATNVSSVVVSINGTIYPTVPVSGGIWALTTYDGVSGTAFPSGSYAVTIKDTSGTVLTNGTLVVTIPSTSAVPTGTLNITGCTITAGTTCAITPGWTVTGDNNGSLTIGVAVFQNGTYFGGSAVSGTSYIFSTNPNSSTSFNLPAGTYNIQLSYYPNSSGSWSQLTTKQIVVTAGSGASMATSSDLAAAVVTALSAPFNVLTNALADVFVMMGVQ